MKKWILIAIGVIILAILALVFLVFQQKKADSFRGPIGAPYVKGPSGMPPQ